MAKSFKQWYAENADKLAERRKKRYDSDPVYRQTQKDRAAANRERVRKTKPAPAITGMSVQDVCAHLDISEWTLASWRKKDYYPDPQRVSGRPVFQHQHLELLGMIKQFFTLYPRRLAGMHKDELKTVIDVVHHNWIA